ncbi:chemotaxis protein CheB [Limnobacter sp.]|uniref:chemotaxis protein CheB n=1 Tax=Limnobacter sp. TaxID=2003368 RepID=UPI0035126E2C
MENLSKPTHIVGIGASAGGLEALEKLFRVMPPSTGMAFVVVQHLSPDFKSLMDELMMRFSTMPVKLIDSEMNVEPNTIYLLAPKKEVVIEGEKLLTYDRPPGKQLSLPINMFFRSLAASWGDKAIAVVLSGTGSDGSDGVLNIRDAGGVVLVQDPATAKFDGMPQSAISTGCVDAVLPPEEIPASLESILQDPLFIRNYGKDEGGEHDLIELEGIQKIYELLRNRFSIDFRLYKPSTITRRIQRRIALQGNAVSIDDYSDQLENDSQELNLLYKDLLIGVTAFFRDIDAYDALRNKALQDLLELVPPSQEFRVWVCGCSTGQEAYSIGMIILEELERHGRPVNVKIFATDLHRDSVTTAAEGVYSETALESVPAPLKEKYFNSLGGGNYKVSGHLRKLIIFSEHNLLKNPPFTRMHLVSCRNLLIYFRADAQVPAVTAFNFSLVKGGILFLGASESLGTLADDFDTVDSHWKIYRKARDSRAALGYRAPGSFSQLTTFDPTSSRSRADRAVPLTRVYQHLLDKHIPSGILLNENNELMHVFGDAHRFMKIPTGRHTGDVFTMLGQSLSIALSTALRNIKSQAISMSYRGIRAEDHEALIELTVDPVFDKVSGRRFYMVLMSDQQIGTALTPDIDLSVVKEDFSLSEESAEYVRQLQLELQRTKEALQTNAEELETSNEELQASNEELQASNEELQSTNEELHSVNEELYTVNTELEQKIVQLDRLTSDLRNLVDSSQIATVFLDGNYCIRVYTPRATDVFNLVRKDLGRDIRHFTPRIPDHQLESDLERAYQQQKSSEQEIEADGRYYLRRCAPHKDSKTGKVGIILTYIDITKIQVGAWGMIFNGLRSVFSGSKESADGMVQVSDADTDTDSKSKPERLS